MFLQGARAGRGAEIMQLIKVLAGLRPTFAAESDLGSVPSPVPICRGQETPALICLSSFFGKSGAQEYARFAGKFRDIREVSAIPEPGFAAGEPLPATIDALVSVHAENIRRSVGDAPFVLAGHSTGGIIAHAVATRLESDGLPPAALVLLDTIAPDRREITDTGMWSLLLTAMLDSNAQWRDGGDDAWLTAMAHYFSLNWRNLDSTAIPTLLVRAVDTAAISSPDDEWQPLSWSHSSQVTVVDVPGDHFTMTGDHADTTARVVNEWLTELPGWGAK
jgi:thioesterase domain-containing protein